MKIPQLINGRFGDPRAGMDQQTLAQASRNGFPVVGRQVQRRDSLGLAAGAIFAVLLGCVTFWSMSSHRAAPEPEPVAPPRRIAELPKPLVAPPPVALPRLPPVVAAPPLEDGLAANRIAAPALVVDVPAEAASAANGPAAPAARKSPLGIDPLPDPIAGSGAMSATRMTDPANTVAQGTLIAAVLETAINSDLPGYVRAVVSQDVPAFDGSQTLIPRGAHLIGQYKSGLADGQTRAYILWQRLIRPDGVSIDLASSPATDFAGHSGLAGDVDTHFFARFGSALLLSVVDMFSAVGNASVMISGGQSAASTALQHDGQIPPTVTVPQGAPIRIFTARDLDFSTVAEETAHK